MRVVGHPEGTVCLPVVGVAAKLVLELGAI